MKFDPTKPVQTRGGRKARVVADDIRNSVYKIWAAVEYSEYNEEIFDCFTESGQAGLGVMSDSDLINIPEKHVRYLNMYHNGGLELFECSAEANNYAGDNRTACIRIEYEDGQFDE